LTTHTDHSQGLHCTSVICYSCSTHTLQPLTKSRPHIHSYARIHVHTYTCTQPKQRSWTFRNAAQKVVMAQTRSPGKKSAHVPSATDAQHAILTQRCLSTLHHSLYSLGSPYVMRYNCSLFISIHLYLRGKMGATVNKPLPAPHLYLVVRVCSLHSCCLHTTLFWYTMLKSLDVVCTWAV